jgi:hypothetical protein
VYSVQRLTTVSTGLNLNPGRGKKFSLLQERLDWLWEPPSLLCNGYRRSFSKVKRPGREVEYSPPSRTQIRTEWSYTYTPPICLHGLLVRRHRAQLWAGYFQLPIRGT